MKKLTSFLTASLCVLLSVTLAFAQAAIYLHASNSSLGTSLLVDANPDARLAGFNCSSITGGAAGYCVAYNSASVPSTGALTGAQVLDWCYFDATPRGCSLSRVPGNVKYSNGIIILLTTAASPFTYTTGTDTGSISADYN